ncbi:MAG TPA: multiheme c-type cytochrome [Candidatus Eisenbacteria bacterium]
MISTRPAPGRIEVVLVVFLAATAAGCARGPELRYAVDLQRPDSGVAQVTLEVLGSPRSGLMLRSYAAQGLVRLSDLTATTLEGRKLVAEVGVDTAAGPDAGTLLVRLERLPPRLLVHYQVRPGARYGDSHTGYVGRCFGYLDGRFGLLNGQNLFLIPRGLGTPARVSVRFVLPAGWTIVAPWMQRGGAYWPGVNGCYVEEHLVSGVVVVGRFHERSLALDETRYRLAYESGISHDDEERATRAIERVVRYVHSVVPGHGPREYVAAIVSTAPFGDDIEGGGWAVGQGGTLAPVTGLRLRQFAQRLIDARLVDAPFRRLIRDRRELWVVDGVRELCAWRAVARAGYADEGAIARDYALAYVSSLRIEGQEWNLERIYSTRRSSDVGRKVAAPLLLLWLDRELRRLGTDTGLEPVLARMFREPHARSLWRCVPSREGDRWRHFRSDFAQAQRPLPAHELFGLSPLAPVPPGTPGRPSRGAFVVFTGSTQGYLENCGCKVNQSGGVARRMTELARLRREHPGAVVIDAGDAFMRPGPAALDYLSEQEQSLYLRVMRHMRYDAVVPGANELMLGPQHFDISIRDVRLPYTVANVKHRSSRPEPEWKLVHAGPLRVAVVGLFEPPRGTLRPESYDRHQDEWQIEDPVHAMKRLCGALGSRADVLIAVGRLTPLTIRRLVRACPEVDLVISTEQEAVFQVEAHGKRVLATDDQPGFIGHTYVAYTQLASYGLSGVALTLDDRNRMVAAEEKDYWLDDKVLDDPGVRTLLDRFYDRVGRTEAAQASVRVPFAHDHDRALGPYVGAARCSTCHRAEFAQWRTTPHASAFKTLLDVHRHYQPRCVACHVVGFGAPGGYRMGDPTFALANVQCEVCHGPGGNHADDPRAGNIRRRVPATVCLECHDSEHSDRFVYDERLPRVMHANPTTHRAPDRKGS